MADTELKKVAQLIYRVNFAKTASARGYNYLSPDEEDIEEALKIVDYVEKQAEKQAKDFNKKAKKLAKTASKEIDELDEDD